MQLLCNVVLVSTVHQNESPIVVVQSPSRVWLFVTPWTATLQASLVPHHLPEFAQVHVHWIDDAIQPLHPLSKGFRGQNRYMYTYIPSFLDFLPIWVTKEQLYSRSSLVIYFIHSINSAYMLTLISQFTHTPSPPWCGVNWDPLQFPRASLVAQLGKNLSAMRETWVLFLGWEDPLETGKATHSSIMAWRIPWTVYAMGLQRVRLDWATFTFTVPYFCVSISSYALAIRILIY